MVYYYLGYFAQKLGQFKSAVKYDQIGHANAQGLCFSIPE